GPTNDVILHVNLTDPSNLLQQEAVGLLGVNLIFAAFYQYGSMTEFLDGLFENLAGRLEVDQVSVHGPVFSGWGERLIQILLVVKQMPPAVIFPAEGAIAPPSEIVRKKAILFAPGTFQMVEEFHKQMLQAGIAELKNDCGDAAVIALFSLAVTPWTKGEE